MSGFSPQLIYERGRQQTLANQPRYCEQFRQLVEEGLALFVESAGKGDWIALAPWSRLEPHLLLAYDLAVEGEAGLRRIEFDVLDFTVDSWGAFYVEGFDVASFRPLVEAEDEELINLWNARSSRAPLQYVAP
jgi:hypothetical protein